MRRTTILLTAVAVIFAACGLDKQAKELRALENCRYEFVSADSVFLAGTDISKLIVGGQLDVSRLPGVALGFLSRDVPLSGMLNIRITNPTNNLAGIQQFAYLIEIEGKEIVNGTSDLPISVLPGETTVVPVKLQANVYPFLSDGKTLNKLLQFMQNAHNGQTTEKIKLTFRIKPTIALGNKQINYPGYISIDKEVDGRFLVDKGILLL